MPRQPVEGAVVGLRVHAPEARAADVGEPRAELVTEQMEYPEDRVRVGPGVGHDLRRLQLGLLLQHDREQGQAVAQRARDGDAVQAGELVGDKVVERDPALLAEVARVRPGVDGADRYDEAQAIGGRHFTPAPGLRERDAGLRGDEGCIGAGPPRRLSNRPDTVGEVAGLHGCAQRCAKSGRHRDLELDKLSRTFQNGATKWRNPGAHPSDCFGAFLISPTVSARLTVCDTVMDGCAGR